MYITTLKLGYKPLLHMIKGSAVYTLVQSF